MAHSPMTPRGGSRARRLTGRLCRCLFWSLVEPQRSQPWDWVAGHMDGMAWLVGPLVVRAAGSQINYLTNGDDYSLTGSINKQH